MEVIKIVKSFVYDDLESILRVKTRDNGRCKQCFKRITEPNALFKMRSERITND